MVASVASQPDDVTDHDIRGLSAVLLDLDLGQGIQFDMLVRLKQGAPQVPVIIISGSTTASVVKRARSLGASAFIRKGENVDRILEIIDLVVWGGNSVFPDTTATPITAQSVTPDLTRRLTRRENDVFLCLRRGSTNKEIALSLGIAEKTVRTHLTEVYKKLGVRNRTEAILL